MKIGILTYFISENPGTFLQAYSVLKLIQKAFPNDYVEIVNYHLYRKIWTPNRRVISVGQWMRDYKRHKKYRASRKKHLTLSQNRMVGVDRESALDFIARQNYDLLVVGSDTILELQHYNGGVGPFWLSPEIKAKKIMLSASCRSETYEKLTASQKSIIKESLAGFSLLGVRDFASKALIGSFLGDDDRVICLPDPTVTYDIDLSFSIKYLNSRKVDLGKPMIGLHLPSYFSWAPELSDMCRKKGYATVSLGPAKYADYVLTDVSPFEWSGLFRFFDMVVTSRFHDSMFCIKNGTPFVNVPPSRDYITNDSDSKYHHLMNSYSLSENIITYFDQTNAEEVFNKMLNASKSFDEQEVEMRLNDDRMKLSNFLDKVKFVCKEGKMRI